MIINRLYRVTSSKTDYEIEIFGLIEDKMRNTYIYSAMVKRMLIFVVIIGWLVTAGVAQQMPKVRQSPLDMVTARHKDTYVKITYSQPSKRGREIFGGLVPYNEVWRTGANEATEITLTRDVFMNGVLLPAGTYSVFTIPEAIRWTIILNRDVGLWGSYNYNPQQDVMRFDVVVQEIKEPQEQFTMKLDANNDRAEWSMLWDGTKVVIPMRFIDKLDN